MRGQYAIGLGLGQSKIVANLCLPDILADILVVFAPYALFGACPRPLNIIQYFNKFIQSYHLGD